MSVYSIVKVGEPILREKAASVKKITPNINKLINNMADTMYENDGIGLAAPQIGISKRVIIVDIGDRLVDVINPEIVSKSEETELGAEGCLSVPGIKGEVERYAEVKVKGLNQNKEEIILEAEGLFARALQHEIDHLDGILFIDKAQRFIE